MKKNLLLLTVIFLVTFSYGQDQQKGFGFDLGYSTSRAAMADVKYFIDKNAFSLGFTYEFNDALGKKSKDIIPGTTAIGDGDYFFSVDVGYTRVLNEKFSVSGEVSIAEKKYYQNLSDNNFSEGAYHRIYKTTSTAGIGGILTYNLTDLFGIFAGYNSLRELDFGMQFKFLH
jgi:hypothetical protein